MTSDENKALALSEKQLGNEAYKKKDFGLAISHYTKASELDPAEMTFLSNLAAVKFEQKEFQECVQLCQRAVDVGRENRADFKVSQIKHHLKPPS